MKIDAEIALEDTVKRTAHGGRVSIGSDYERKDVRAVVLEVFDEDGDGEQLVEKLETTGDGKIVAHVDADEIVTGTADQQGRLRIGKEFEGQEVRVAVLGAVDSDRQAAEHVIGRLQREGEQEAARTVADVFGIRFAE